MSREKDKEIAETLNSVLTVIKGLETLKEQFFEHDLFKSAWDLGYTEGFYTLLKGFLMSDHADNYTEEENIKVAIIDLQNKMKEAQSSLLKALNET